VFAVIYDNRAFYAANMEQYHYRRRNIGPLTRYGRFKGYNRTNRQFARGRRYLRPTGIPGYRVVPYSRAGQILTVRKMMNQVTNSSGQVPISSGGITWPATSGTDGFGGCSHILADLPDDAAYTSIYDQYRIVKVEMWIIPRVTQVDMDDTGTRQNPWLMYIVEDKDDSTPPSAVESVLAHNSVRVIDLRKKYYFKYYPSVTPSVFAGGTFSGYSIANGGKKGPWIDCANTSVPYYGLKWAIPGPVATSNSFSVTTLFRYTVEFRGQR